MALGILAMLVAPLATAADLCADVAELRAAPRDFVPMRGAAASEPGTWSTTRSFIDPAWHCQVQDRADDLMLRCASDWDDDAQRVRAQAGELMRGLNGCFGDAWKRRVQRRSDRAITIYYSPDGSGEFDAFIESREKPGLSGIAGAVGVPVRRQLQWRLGVVTYRLSGGDSTRGPQEPLPDARRFCDVLKQVIEAADSRFESLRGAKSGDSRQATVALPGLTACDITNYETWIGYSCRAASHENRGAVRRDQESMATLVTGCLGATWSVSRRPHGDGIWTVDIGRTDKDGNDEPTSMTLRGRKAGDAYMLHVDVDRNIE